MDKRNRDKQVTIVDIARRLGVSAKAVSSCLNGTGRFSAALREKVRGAALSMSYHPNLAARQLVQRRSFLIGVMIPFASVSFFSRILDPIREAAQRAGMGVLLGNGGSDPASIEQGMHLMTACGVSGLVICPQVCNWQCFARLLAGFSGPVVQIMDHYPQIGSNYVDVNNIAGAQTATEELLRLGHRRVGLLSHDGDNPSMAQRRLGYRAALENAHVPYRAEWTENCSCTMAGGEEAARTLLARAPELTALFAASDVAALGAIHAVLALGRQVPRDFSVIGFDDMDIAACQAVLPLSTVAQPQVRIGEVAGQLLLELLQGRSGGGMSLSCELKLRATSAAPLQQA